MHIVYTCLCIMYKYTCYLFKLFAKKNLFKKRERMRERLTKTCNGAKLQEHCMLNCALLT